MTHTRRKSAAAALIIGPVVGVAYPFIQVAVDCREPASEACVWGKALLPLSVAVSVVILGALASMCVFAVLEWRRRAKQPDDAA